MSVGIGLGVRSRPRTIVDVRPEFSSHTSGTKQQCTGGPRMIGDDPACRITVSSHRDTFLGGHPLLIHKAGTRRGAHRSSQRRNSTLCRHTRSPINFDRSSRRSLSYRNNVRNRIGAIGENTESERGDNDSYNNGFHSWCRVPSRVIARRGA